MKPEIKPAWIAALRSGKYQQTTGRLRDSNGFCCLGVLCDLSAKAGIGRWDADLPNWFDTGGAGESVVLPQAVVDWAGMASYSPEIDLVALATYNDGDAQNEIKPHSFTEIADLIEKHL
jgi:hypothetical protein